MSPEAAHNQPFFSHLNELRQRLIKSLVSLLLGFSVSIYFAKDIYQFLTLPLQKVLPSSSYFISTQPFEALITYFKTALFAGFFLVLPVIFWQIWAFIAPGLYKSEKKHSIVIVFLIALFFMGGGLFGYYCVFPYAFKYFVQLTQDTNIVFLPQMKDYLSFASRMLLIFGLIFEMPVIMMILTRTGLVTCKALSRFRRYMIVITFTIAAILTPPDVVSQVFLALPMIFLYEIGLLLSWIVQKGAENPLHSAV